MTLYKMLHLPKTVNYFINKIVVTCNAINKRRNLDYTSMQQQPKVQNIYKQVKSQKY